MMFPKNNKKFLLPGTQKGQARKECSQEPIMKALGSVKEFGLNSAGKEELMLK